MAKLVIDETNVGYSLFHECKKYLFIIEMEKPLSEDLIKDFKLGNFWRVSRTSLKKRNLQGTDGFEGLKRHCENLVIKLNQLGY